MKSVSEPKNPDFHVNERWRFLFDSLCRRGKLSRQGNSDIWIFEKYTQLYSLAASVGFLIGKRGEVKASYTPFSLNEINSDFEWNSLRCIAWKATECDVVTLLDYRMVIRICDEFAEGGLQYLNDQYFASLTTDGYLYVGQNNNVGHSLAMIFQGLKGQL